MHRFWGESFLWLAHGWRAPLVAGAVALGVALAARRLRRPGLGALAGGLGLAAGWAAVVGIVFQPHGAAARLPLLGLGLAAASLATTRKRFHVSPGFVLLLAMISGWWLAGLPLDVPALRRVAWAWVVGFAWMGALGLTLAGADRWRVAAASCALAAALAAVGTPGAWPVLALVPAGAVLGAPLAVLVASLGVGAVAGGAVIGAGRLTRGGIGPVEAAALAPFAAVWLSERLLPRFRRLRGMAPALSAVAAVAGVALAAFFGAALTGLR